MTEDFGKLDFYNGKATYTYKGVVYEIETMVYEPLLIFRKDGEDVFILHNSYTIEQLRKAFTAGGTVRDFNDQEYDEETFCKILAASLDSKRNQMDLYYAAKLVKD